MIYLIEQIFLTFFVKMILLKHGDLRRENTGIEAAKR